MCTISRILKDITQPYLLFYNLDVVLVFTFKCGGISSQPFEGLDAYTLDDLFDYPFPKSLFRWSPLLQVFMTPRAPCPMPQHPKKPRVQRKER